jgi:hypothetical protein
MERWFFLSKIDRPSEKSAPAALEGASLPNFRPSTLV